jgi:hypothetical protein
MARTHGLTANNFDNGRLRRVHRIWANMLQRCTNPNNARFADYGARGIKVCKRWERFDLFLADMGVPPPKHTLDRKNNNRGYSPANCQWADAFQQAQNSRRATHVTVGKVTKCISEWCRSSGVSYGLYKARMKRGWTQERALTTPPANRGLRALWGIVDNDDFVPRAGKVLRIRP